MSREPPDREPVDLNPLGGEPLDRDARALFAAGARDQAPARLRAALLARARADVRESAALTELRTDGRREDQRAHGVRAPELPARRATSRGRSWIGPALAAAAGIVAAFSVWSVRRASPDERLLISAEHVPVAAPATPDPRPFPEPPLPEAPRAAPNAARELEAQAARARSGPPARTAKPAAASLPAVSADSAALSNAVAGSAASPAVSPPAVASGVVAPLPASPTDASPTVASQRVPSQPAAAGAASLAAPAARPLAADVRRQLELLQSVQKALRAGEGQRALELLDSPGSQLEQGDFAAEARLMRIEALAGTGRRSEATSLAREFLKLFPHSPLADRARRFGAAAP